MKKTETYIYTDGSCVKNPGKGGYGFVIIYDNKIIMQGDYSRKTTNNLMELQAIIAALKRCYKLGIYKDIKVFTDSKYCQNGIEYWIKGWLKNDFKNGKIKNQAYWRQIVSLQSTMQFKAIWIRNHSGNYYNEIVDNIAKDCANKQRKYKSKEIKIRVS